MINGGWRPLGHKENAVLEMFMFAATVSTLWEEMGYCLHDDLSYCSFITIVYSLHRPYDPTMLVH